MDRQIFVPVPVPVLQNKNPTMYTICVISSILQFACNMIFLILMLLYLDGHPYDVITEWMAMHFTLVLTWGLFISLAILYTVTMNEQAYHDLRTACLVLAALYGADVLITSIWLLLEWISGMEHSGKLLALVIWPMLVMIALYGVTWYTFHFIYTPVMGFIPVPTTSNAMPGFPYQMQPPSPYPSLT